MLVAVMGAATTELPPAGLTSARAEELLREVGRNEVPAKEVSKLWMLLKQFYGLMPFMIEVAGILAIVAADWTSFGVIVFMLTLNAIIGVHG